MLSALGAFLLLLGVGETCTAVLYPRAVSGPVTAAVYRLQHFALRNIFRPNGKAALASGTLLVITQAIIWATLLLAGTSLIVWPQLGRSIENSSGNATSTDLVSAIYYAGFSLTTLGTGDFVPTTDFARIVTITAAAIGFSFFTLVLAYILAVYSALQRRNQFATEVDCRTGRTGDSYTYLRSYLMQHQVSLLDQDLTSLTAGLIDLMESHHFYPTLHYFRFGEPRYAMSRMLRFCLEVSTVVLCLNDVRMRGRGSEPAERLWHASLQTLEDTMKHFVVCRARVGTPDMRLAERVVEQIVENGEPDFNAAAFLRKFSDRCSVWTEDLQSLGMCTMAVRRSSASSRKVGGHN